MEAEITGGLEHPGIVPVYGLGCHVDGRPFYAMRFIRDESLMEAIARCQGPQSARFDRGEKVLSLRRLLGYFVDVCNAAAYAHSRGVIHRDLKPENVMLGPYGETLLVGWGLAKVVGRAEPSEKRQDEDGPREEAKPTLRPATGSPAPTQGRGRRHAGLHEPRAGGRLGRPVAAGQRYLRAGGDALRDPDRQAPRSRAPPWRKRGRR